MTARLWAAGFFLFASMLAVVSPTGSEVLFGMGPGLALAAWVQWRATHGGLVERARLWYAAPPLWWASAVPVALLAPLPWVDRVLVAGGLVATSVAAQVRSLEHEKVLELLHGPVTHRAFV